MPIRQDIFIKCSNCNKNKKTIESEISKRKNHFCGKECYLNYLEKTSYVVHCAQCNKVIRKTHKHRHRINYFCSNPCRYKWNRGANNYGWVGGTSTYRGENWNGIVKVVLKRDSYKCIISDEKIGKRKLDVHHIIPFRIINGNHLWNLVTLNRSLHKRVEFLSKSIVSEFTKKGFSMEQSWKFVLIFFNNALMKKKLSNDFMVKMLYSNKQNNIYKIVNFLIKKYEESKKIYYLNRNMLPIPTATIEENKCPS